MLFRSLKLGRLFHIDIFLHWTMWILPVFILVRGLCLYAMDEAFLQLGLIFGIYIVLFVHEIAHIAAAGWLRLRIRDITLYPIGEWVRLAELSERPWKEVRIASAGVLIHVFTTATIGAILVGLGFSLSPKFEAPEPYVETFFNRLFWLNVLIAAIHMLPAFPLDGGQVFRGLLALSAKRLRATEVASMLSSLIAILFLIAGMVWMSTVWWMIAMGIVIHVSGQQELMTVRYFASLQMAEPPLPTGAPILAPIEQLLDDESRPQEPNFTGVIWSSRTRLWVVWRNGQPISANALVGE